MAPSGVQKERMEPEDLFVLDAKDGRVLHEPAARPPPYNPPKLSECAPLFMSVRHCFHKSICPKFWKATRCASSLQNSLCLVLQSCCNKAYPSTSPPNTVQHNVRMIQHLKASQAIQMESTSIRMRITRRTSCEVRALCCTATRSMRSWRRCWIPPSPPSRSPTWR